MYNLKDGLTDNMFKIKMEQLRNNRASKIASRKAFTLSYICNIILTVKVRKMLGVKTIIFAQHIDTTKTDNCIPDIISVILFKVPKFKFPVHF